MKPVLFAFCCLCLFAPAATLAQYYDRAGDAWIDYDQIYVEFKVVEDGVYRVGAGELRLPADAAPVNLRLYYRGREQALFVANGGDPNRLDGGDFVEFFGRRADGAEDRFLYRDAYTGEVDSTQIGNEYFSLFGDTSHYFLTWSETPRPAQFSMLPHSSASAEAAPRAHFARQEALVFPTAWPFSFTYWQGGGRAFSPNFVLNPDFTTGEGYMTRPFNGRGEIAVPTPEARADAVVPPRLTAKLVGISSIPEHKIAVQAGAAADTFLIEGVNNRVCELDLPSGLEETTIAAFEPLNHNVWGASLDNISLAWLRLDYERRLRFEGAREALFRLPARAETTAVAVTGFENEEENVWLYDLTAGLRVEGAWRGDTLLFALPASTVASECFVATEAAILARSQDKLWTDRPPMRRIAAPENAADIILITYPALRPSAEAYAEYRENHPDRPLSVEIVNTSEIYEEFGYGAVSSLAIKRFIRKCWETWSPKPRYVLLWGKSWYARGANENNVPTWGQPASDWKYATNFYPEAPDHAPKLAVGRLDLNFNDNASGFAYVEKLRAHEALPEAEWRRRGVFLGGGNTDREQASFLSNLREWAGIYKSAPHGGTAVVNQKGVLIEEQPATPKEAINEGAGFVVFMGHSTSQVLDVDLQFPQEYQNYGKTPFILGNGCYSADLNTSNSLAARFVSEPERGAIGYASSSTASYPSTAAAHATQFMRTAFKGPAGRAQSEILAETARELFRQTNFSAQLYNHVLTTNLVGDPAALFYAPSAPDPALTGDAVVFEETLREGMKQIAAVARVRNLGRLDSQTVVIAATLANEYAAGPVEILRDTILFTEKYIEKSLLLELPRLAADNRFLFRIFPESDADSSNNEYFLNVSALPDAPVALAPQPFAAVPEPGVLLKAALPLETPAALTYYFEIDTSYRFDSPALLRSGPVPGDDALGEWRPELALDDSTVYFWRVRAELAEGGPVRWSAYSFRHLAGRPEGWAQARPPQFLENPAVGAALSTADWNWRIAPDTVDVRLRAGSPRELLVGGGKYAAAEAAINDFGFAVYLCELDAETLAPLDSTNSEQFGSFGDVGYYYIPEADAVNALYQRLGEVKEGNYLAMIGVSPLMDTWPDSLRDRLTELGLPDSTLDSLYRPHDHFCIFAKKGEYVRWQTEPNGHNNTRLLETEILRDNQTARLYSPRIGPAERWDTLFATGTAEKGAFLRIWGASSAGGRVLLADSLTAPPGGEIRYDLSGLDANEYPFLELEAELGPDNALSSWHVFYAQRPDFALTPQQLAELSADTADAAQPMRAQIAARHLTGAAKTDLPVNFVIKDEAGSFVSAFARVVRFGENGAGVAEVDFTAPIKAGTYRLEAELNPEDAPAERYRFNNFWRQTFYVRADARAPRLRVLLNGATPRDGQIVSPSPVFEARLMDDHPYLPLPDTSAIEWYLREPGDPFFLPARKLSYAQGEVELLTSETRGEIRARFAPQNLAPGVYALEAQGRDASDNVSGSLRYSISFEVATDVSYTNLLFYPNPFTGALRARLQLTGAELPESCVVELYGATGQKVAALDLSEGHEFRPGLNETGNLLEVFPELNALPTGLYYYRTAFRYTEGAEPSRRGLPESTGDLRGALLRISP